MSWRDTWKRLTGGGKKKEDSVSLQMLQKAGFQIVRTDQLSERLNKGEGILKILTDKVPDDADSPDKVFEFRRDTFEQVWNLVYKATQIAYLRSGSNAQFGTLTSIIEKCKARYDIAVEANEHRLKALASQLTEAEKNPEKNKRLVEKLKTKKEQLVRNFYVTWIILFMKPKLGVMGNMCWVVEDVNIPETIAIQSNQPISRVGEGLNELRDPNKDTYGGESTE